MFTKMTNKSYFQQKLMSHQIYLGMSVTSTRTKRIQVKSETVKVKHFQVFSFLIIQYLSTFTFIIFLSKLILVHQYLIYLLLVQHKKGVEGSDKKSKTRLITSLRRNASTRRVVYPDLVWQRSRDNLLGTDKSAVIYSNVLPLNSAMKSNENQVDGERHYQNLLPGTIV